MDFWNAIPLTNRQPKLACPVDFHVGDVCCLHLCVGHPGDVRKIEGFLYCVEHGRDWVVQFVIFLLDYFLPFQKLVRNQLTAVVLKVRKYTRHSVVDRFCGPVADIR